MYSHMCVCSIKAPTQEKVFTLSPHNLAIHYKLWCRTIFIEVHVHYHNGSIETCTKTMNGC